MDIAKNIIVLIVCILGLMAGKAAAALVTIGLEGEIVFVGEGGLLQGRISVGDPITGYYRYDSNTPDTNPAAEVGDYWHDRSPYGIFLTIGGFDFQTDPANVRFVIEIVDNKIMGGRQKTHIWLTATITCRSTKV